MKMTSILLTLTLAAATGCATMKRTVALGVGIGMAGGAASGALIAQRMRGEEAMEMGIVAAILGGLSAYFIHQEIDQRGEKVRWETLSNLESYGRPKQIKGVFYE